jgi:Zn-dependent membrane protease YugP
MLGLYFGLGPGYWIVMLIGAAISAIAQARVMSNFKKYAKVPVGSGMRGAEAAAAVCRARGVHDVTIERHKGFLSDHYDPRSRTLRLSPEVYEGNSISSVAVAAHEAGHAIQHADEYGALGFRTAMVKFAATGSRLWFILFLAGMFLGGSAQALGTGLLTAAVACFGAVVLFQLVTLPVEFDASRRAKLVLANTGIVTSQAEKEGVEKVLGAAAMTYVAAAAASLLQLLWLLSILAGRRD